MGLSLYIKDASYTAAAPPADGRPYVNGFNVEVQDMTGKTFTFVMFAGERFDFPFRNVVVSLVEQTVGTLVGTSLEVSDIPIVLDKEHLRARPAAGFSQGQYGQIVVTGTRRASQVNVSGTGLVAGTTTILTAATVGNKTFCMTHLEIGNTAAVGATARILTVETTTGNVRSTSILQGHDHDDNDWGSDPICFDRTRGVNLVISNLVGNPTIDYTLTGFYE
jgi:hypothetical protein